MPAPMCNSMDCYIVCNAYLFCLLLYLVKCEQPPVAYNLSLSLQAQPLAPLAKRRAGTLPTARGRCARMHPLRFLGIMLQDNFKDSSCTCAMNSAQVTLHNSQHSSGGREEAHVDCERLRVDTVLLVSIALSVRMYQKKWGNARPKEEKCQYRYKNC